MTTAEGTAATSAPQPSLHEQEAAARLGDLFRRHSRMVLGLCRSLLRDGAEAEDAAQQAFLSAHRSLLGGIEPHEPAAWLATIARNECRQRIRTRMRSPLALAEAAAELPDPLVAAIRNEDVRGFWRACSALPKAQREALLLREFGGLSYADLAAALAVSEPAIESLLFRARQRLRSSLAPLQAGLAVGPLRDALARALPGFQPAAKVASLPLAAKLAAVTVTVGVIAAGAAHVATVHHAPQRAAPPRGRVAAPPRTPVLRSAPAHLVVAHALRPAAAEAERPEAEHRDAAEQQDPPEAGVAPDGGDSSDSGGDSLHEGGSPDGGGDSSDSGSSGGD